MRAGAQALSVLSVPLNDHVLRALAEQPRPLVELRRAVGSPPQTTMRGHLRTLTELGVIERHRQSDFPGSVDYELAAPGRELLAVREVLGNWLLAAPDGPVSLGSPAAKSTVKALVDGWSATIVRALAARPLSLTELNRLIAGHNYPSLERRLGAMRLGGLLEPCQGEGRRTPYAVGQWLRRAVAPLAAAARWERRHEPEGAAGMSRIDIEALFLLAVPLARLTPERTGACRLVAEVRDSKGGHDLAGALVGIRDGEVVSCVSRLQGDAGASASGSISTWLRALLGEESDRLELGGDVSLASDLVEATHGRLFPAARADSLTP